MTSTFQDKVLQEDALSTEDYQFLCSIVYKQSRINLGDKKKSFLSSRLLGRRNSLHIDSWKSYCQFLKSTAVETEIDILIDLIATNHTSFFRENQQLKRVEEEIIPTLVDIDRNRLKELKLWSAACSSGEEPYSLAITVSEFFRKNQNLKNNWSVYASDISQKALKIAEKAIYNETKLNLPDPELLERYFSRGLKSYTGKCRIKKSIKDKVRLKRINLFQPIYPLPHKYHIILCRNTLIYFDRKSQELLVSKLYNQLDPGGYLVVGYSDSLALIKHQFKSIGGGFFQKAETES